MRHNPALKSAQSTHVLLRFFAKFALSRARLRLFQHAASHSGFIAMHPQKRYATDVMIFDVIFIMDLIMPGSSAPPAVLAVSP